MGKIFIIAIFRMVYSYKDMDGREVIR